MAHLVSLIHGVDSFKTLKEINKQAKKHNRVINCLLQAKIATEDTKFGLSFSEIEEILSSKELETLDNISINGLMGMATFTDDIEQVEAEFSKLNMFFEKQKTIMFKLKGTEELLLTTAGKNHFEFRPGSLWMIVGAVHENRSITVTSANEKKEVATRGRVVFTFEIVD